MSKHQKVNILNMHFDSLSKEDLVNHLCERIDSSAKTFVVTANPEIVMHGNHDLDYLHIVNHADFVIADGFGVILGSKIIGNEIPERIAGFDLMTKLLEKANEESWSVYFLGAKEEVIDKAVRNIKVKFPKLMIAGWQNGYVNVHAEEFKQDVASKKPDLIFVGLGFPSQENWVSQSLPYFEKGLFMGVGGSYDVWAGEVKRAPLFWQKLNIEWLYRLIQQPKRWKRMTVLPVFVLKMIKERFKN